MTKKKCIKTISAKG